MSGGLESLTGAYGNGLLPQDPAYLPAMQRLALARSIAGEGMNASPTTGLGALARGLQGLIGGYELNQGNQAVQNTMAQRQAGVQKAVDDARMLSPLGAAMAGPVPQAAPAPSTVPVPGVPAPTPATAGGAPAPYAPSGYPGAQAGAAPVTATPIPLAPIVHQLETSGSMAPGQTGDGGAAAGPMQVHQAALDDVNRSQGTNYTLQQLRDNPQLGMQEGNVYLDLQQQRFPGRPDLALAAYNAGPTATANAGGPGVPGVPPAAAPYVAKGEAMMGGETPAAPAAPGATPQTGLANPNILSAYRMMQAAHNMVMADPYNPLTRQAAANVAQEAQTLMGMDTFSTGPGGVQTNLRTGQQMPAATPLAHYEQTAPGVYSDSSGTHAPTFAPTPRPYTTVGGITGAVGPGGQNTILSDNPSGVSGNSPEANAMRTMANLAPVIQGGNATPQQMASYATAADTWRAPAIHPDPASGALVRLNTRELPPGFPEPPSIGPTGSGAAPSSAAPTPGALPGATPLTGGSRGPAAAQEITENQAKNDADEISKDQATTMAGHNVLGTTATIRSMAPQVTTGVGADQRLAASNILSSLGVAPDTVKEWVGTSTAPGQILQKKLFELSTGATRAMGAREPGSVMLMFQKNYPGMTSNNMTIDAMTRLIDMDQVYKENEIGGRQQYFTGQVQNVAQGKPYAGLSGYRQPDPRVYQAAALATGGMPYSVWTQGLTPAQQTQALQLGSKVYGPGASALDANGVRHTFQPPQPPQGVPNGGP